jgi:hypothetical protein
MLRHKVVALSDVKIEKMENPPVTNFDFWTEFQLDNISMV